MGKRCRLCGGKLRNGICTECGMDNRKTDEKYSRHAEKNASAEHIHEAEHTTAEKKTKSNSVRNQFVSKKQTQHSEVKNIKVIFYGAAVLLVLAALFLSKDNSEADLELNTEVQEEVFDMSVENAEQEVQFPVIAQWENTLESGLYVVGVDIPAGEYTITAPPGSIFQTYNNPQYEDEHVSFGKAPSGIEEVKNIPLYEGTLVRVSGSNMRFFSWDAEVENLTERVENPLTNQVQIIGKAVAGRDFAAGTYDIEAVGEKEGTFTYSYKDKIQMSIWLKPMQTEGNLYTSVYYRNVVLPEGTQIDTGDMTVMLVPSKGIVSEDSASFYENTISQQEDL